MTPAIDLIEIIAARGNTTLDSTVQLTVSLRNDINDFGKRMNELTAPVEGDKDGAKRIVDDMKSLLARIEDAVPLISLALTTSGANLSASLPNTVSPSRLLQASSALQAGDARFDTLKETQIGPSFSLKLYTIFEGHARTDPTISNISWQETYAKCILEIFRMPMKNDVQHDGTLNVHYLYHFRVTENLADGRYHDELDSKDVKKDDRGFIRGASRDLPVHIVARLFFSASGRLLNIEESRTPVLVLKVNHALKGPSSLVRAVFDGEYGGDDTPREDPDDIEWLAFELWQDEDTDSDSESGTDTNSEDELAMRMQVLNTRDQPPTLSLLEYLLRLAALQTSEQASVLTITDERISLYLRDEQPKPRDEAIRRTSNERYNDTPASLLVDELPGTVKKPLLRSSPRSPMTPSPV